LRKHEEKKTAEMEIKAFRHHWAMVHREEIMLSGLLITGLFLRLYRLGDNSFWYDEAGVAIAASAHTVHEMLSIVRSHAAAMPLDYLVAWFVARIDLSETMLRLPSVMWGTLSLGVAYLIYKQLADPSVAKVAVLLLALSPLHLQFSRELRFYAALIFFYLLLTHLLMRAVAHSHKISWMLAGAVALVGAYFHYFVMLAFINIACWIYFKPVISIPKFATWKRFIICLVAVSLAVLPGYFYFSSADWFHYEFIIERVPISIIQAMGWFPMYASSFTPITGGISFLLALVGIITSCRQKNSLENAIMISIIIQVVFIMAIVIWKGYFHSPRQLIMLLPFSSYWTARGFYHLYHRHARISLIPWSCPPLQSYLPINRLFAVSALVIIFVLTAPNLDEYFKVESSRARPISQFILEDCRPGDTLASIPPWETLLFQFYIEKRLTGSPDCPAMIDLNWENMDKLVSAAGRVYVVMWKSDYPQYSQIMSDYGFQPDPTWGHARQNSHILLVTAQ
jgi:uncharacterized membrane protein